MVIAVPARTGRIVQGVLDAKLSGRRGCGLHLAMVPRWQLIQRVRDYGDGVRVEERASSILLLLHVQAGAARAVGTLLLRMGVLLLLLACLASEKALASGLLATRAVHCAL